MIRRYNTKRDRIKMRIRSKITGTALRPRLSVFRSNKYFYAQLIDDEKRTTLCSASVSEIEKAKNAKSETAFLVGQLLAKKALALKIGTVVFDRNGFAYHGRVAEFARGVREGGIKF